MRNLIVFTDLDGTLVEEGTYDSWPSEPVVRELLARGAALVPVTSRARREVEKLRAKLGLSGPYIVENGSAILMGDGSKPVVMGCTVEEATASFRQIQQQVGDLTSLSDLTLEEVARITGLGQADAELARDREYGVVILPAARATFARAAALASPLGCRMIEGDRFWHLVGNGADKGRAVRALVDHLSANRQHITVGLGNGPSDISVLEVVDLPIVIPGPQGAHAALAGRGWRVAPWPGPRGWAAALDAVLSSANEGHDPR